MFQRDATRSIIPRCSGHPPPRRKRYRDTAAKRAARPAVAIRSLLPAERTIYARWPVIDSLRINNRSPPLVRCARTLSSPLALAATVRRGQRVRGGEGRGERLGYSRERGSSGYKQSRAHYFARFRPPLPPTRHYFFSPADPSSFFYSGSIASSSSLFHPHLLLLLLAVAYTAIVAADPL